MVKMLFNLFNKRKLEIERLNKVIAELVEKSKQFEQSIRIVHSKNTLLLREKDDLINVIKDYETQIKILNITIGDLTRTDNNSRYY